MQELRATCLATHCKHELALSGISPGGLVTEEGTLGLGVEHVPVVAKDPADR
jgi:hypothetical protein